MHSIAEPVAPVVVHTPAWVVALNLTAKTLLLLLVLRVAVDPAWGNLEGKAPGTRAMTYPLIACVVPVVHLFRARGTSYPWTADTLLIVPAFSDLLGNRLDLYDRVVWFDDAVHFVNTGVFGAAVLVLCGGAAARLWTRLQISVASGVSLALAWELWEYLAFVRRSGEVVTAYRDTVGDLTLGWAGTVVAALVVGLVSMLGDHAREAAGSGAEIAERRPVGRRSCGVRGGT